MDAPQRRLHLVTGGAGRQDAEPVTATPGRRGGAGGGEQPAEAHAGDGDAHAFAATHSKAAEEPDVDQARATAGRSHGDAERQSHATVGPGEDEAQAQVAARSGAEWARVERRHRWGTPALVAARVAVVLLLVSATAAISIVVTRPSAPEHQPELPEPAPPTEWGQGPAASTEMPGEVSANDGSASGSTATDAAGETSGSTPEPDGTERSAGDDPAEGGPSGGQMVVHVAGEVLEPGIVELPPDARLHDALLAAGGPTSEADLAAINLAALAVDGQQIYLPAHGEDPPTPAGPAPRPNGPAPPPGGSQGAPDGPGTSEPVDLNNADAAALQTLPGIGPALADRILAHRRDNGPFGSVDDLMAVSGIGPATFARLRELVAV